MKKLTKIKYNNNNNNKSGSTQAHAYTYRDTLIILVFFIVNYYVALIGRIRKCSKKKSWKTNIKRNEKE